MRTFKHLYHVENLPVLQNRVFSDPDDALNCAKGDLDLVQDLRTGLVFNQAFNPALMNYDSNYQNEQGLSLAFQSHLRDVLSILDAHFLGLSILEVGCGKGTFLQMMRARGYAVTGIDPTYEGDDPEIRKEYFTPGAGVSADAIVLRHVLEHVERPYEFLLDIKKANGGRGKIYIEVPCFDWICSRRAWFDVFYEHVNYFRLSDFSRMFGRISASGRFFGEQYLYVVADLESLVEPVCSASDEVDFPIDFLRSLNSIAADVKLRKSRSGAKVVVWGASSKGVVFFLFMRRAGVDIDYAVDINQTKQGMYIPSTALRVISPKELFSIAPCGSEVLVMNGNYLPEILSMTNGNYNCVAVDNDKF